MGEGIAPEGVVDVTSEVMAFTVAAVVVGALTMGGVTWVYFLDKWRVDPGATGRDPEARAASPFDRAA